MFLNNQGYHQDQFQDQFHGNEQGQDINEFYQPWSVQESIYVNEVPLSQLSQLGPNFKDIQTNGEKSKDTRETSIKKLNENRCYTCKPRGKVAKHIITASDCNNFVFHHDMNNRPLILVTPVYHIQTITDMSPEHMALMFASIKSFCNFWNITDYQVSFNNGNWQQHNHFHIKIKISEKIALRMKRDHFNRIQRESHYS
jgi:GH18 family chitinase